MVAPHPGHLLALPLIFRNNGRMGNAINKSDPTHTIENAYVKE
jgi:hypothetical protein